METHTLYSGKYGELWYDQNLQLISSFWKKKSETMNEAEYRMITSDILDTLETGVEQENWKITSLLADNRHFLFTMSPKLQEWQAKHIFAKLLVLGLKKSAIVMSEEFISQFSIEQTFEESPETNEITRYFDNIEEARNWVISEELDQE